MINLGKKNKWIGYFRTQWINTTFFDKDFNEHNNISGSIRSDFFVKNWNLNSSIDFVMYEGYSDFNLNNGKTVKAEEKTGVSGQGNNNPRSTFGNHAIVKYSGNYFDPSYGSSIANDANSWETPALDGFGSIVFFNDGSVQKFINWIGHINDNSPQSNIYP